MAVYIVVVILALAAYIFLAQKGLKDKYGIYCLVMIACGILGLALEMRGEEPADPSEAIERPEPGAGSVEKEYMLSVDELDINEPYSVVVENRHLTGRELEELFSKALGELETAFLGENESLDHVTSDLVLVDVLADGMVGVSWSFDSYDAITADGRLREDELDEDGRLIEATATLSYEGATAKHTFSIMAYPPEKTATELFFENLAREFQSQNEGLGTEVALPGSAGGYAIEWGEKKKEKPVNMLLFGICAMAAVAVGKKDDARKAKARRDAQLMEEYPQMLNQMALLLGAGMTVGNAWEKIALGYEKKRQEHGAQTAQMPVYEEMLVTYRQIQDGMGERRAYEEFGERLGLQPYRRLATLLVQNLRKGTRGLSRLMEKEMQSAYDEQAGSAKKRGEELQTKLLLPMMLMLALVIVIIMIPAMASFQL